MTFQIERKLFNRFLWCFLGPRGAPCSDGKPGLQGPPGKIRFPHLKINRNLLTRSHFPIRRAARATRRDITKWI